MLTYKATNKTTGRFYIGSARTLHHFTDRIRQHHKSTAVPDDFHKDLWEDCTNFTWEIVCIDELKIPSLEKELIKKHSADSLLYNQHRWTWEDEKELKDGLRWSKETKEKMRASAKSAKAQPAHKKEAQSRAASATNAKKQPCPQCGMLMNVGNLTKHLKGTRCKGQQQIG